MAQIAYLSMFHYQKPVSKFVFFPNTLFYFVCNHTEISNMTPCCEAFCIMFMLRFLVKGNPQTSVNAIFIFLINAFKTLIYLIVIATLTFARNKRNLKQ